MSIEFIDLKRQQARIRPEVEQAIAKVLDSGQYIMGDECRLLEHKLAEYVGVKHCLACANGTDAIRLALVALDVQPGDMILTTNFTFFATSEVIAELGAIPLFVDVDETYNICPVDLTKVINMANEKQYPIKGIVSVDLFGLPADHISIDTIAKEHSLWHVEDSAQGFGGKIQDGVAGSFGSIATTSFFPAKPLGCYGDGGAIFTNDDKLAEKIESLRVHGKGDHKYENVRIGYNSRLDTIQAAILLEKLKIFDDELMRKNNLANFYTEELTAIKSVKTPIILQGFFSSWAQYTLQVEDRDALMLFLKEKGVPSTIYYPKTMSQTTALQVYSEYQLSSLEKSEEFVSKVISLPMHAYLTPEEKNLIVATVKEFYSL